MKISEDTKKALLRIGDWKDTLCAKSPFGEKSSCSYITFLPALTRLMVRRKSRILAVDDERDITATFKKSLEKAGFEVDTFNDSLEALSHFKPDYYDLFLLDIKMPNLNGFRLYREMRKIDSKPKVCFITAFDMYYTTSL